MSSVSIRYRELLSQLRAVIPSFILFYFILFLFDDCLNVCVLKVPWAVVPMAGCDSQFYFILFIYWRLFQMLSVSVKYRELLPQLRVMIPSFFSSYLLTTVSNVVCVRKVPWAAAPTTGGDSQLYLFLAGNEEAGLSSLDVSKYWWLFQMLSVYVFCMFVWYREVVSQLPTTGFDSHLHFIWPEKPKQLIL